MNPEILKQLTEIMFATLDAIKAAGQLERLRAFSTLR